MEEEHMMNHWIMTAMMHTMMMNGIPDTIFSLNPMKNAATTAGISKEEFAPSLMNLMPLLRTGATAVIGLNRRGDGKLFIYKAHV